MNHRFTVTFVLLCALGATADDNAATDPKPDETRSVTTATGIVFHDANGNQKRDAGELPVANVRVSNGVEIVRTDEHGRYSLPITEDTIIFVVKPRGWRTPLSNDNRPRFYYIHKPAGSPPSKYAGVAPTGDLPESVDFPLYRQEEPKQFRAVMFGDPQPRTQAEVDYIAHDIVEELIGIDASFGVTLGDIVFDDLNLFDAQAKAIGLIGIPWYNVVGNHDINFDAKNDRLSDETFERAFGPSYYSFDYGPVHFIVLDDIEWYIDSKENKGRYRGGLGETQLKFVRNDLALIPEDQMVVLMMHIPLINVHDRQKLYRLIEKRPFTLSISGHTHYHEHVFIDNKDSWKGAVPHHHIINVTVSGSWWSGAPDERGIPHTTMRDGAPNGYSILSFDGTEYKLDFKAAGRPADYQMQIHAPDEIIASKSTSTAIYANVFNGSTRSKVEMRLGSSGAWTLMDQVREVDPAYQRVVDLEESIDNLPWRKTNKPMQSGHLWRATLKTPANPGVYALQVRTRDMHGRVYSSRRVVRVVADPTPAEPQH